MTNSEIDALTVGEVRAIVERASKALAALAEARALLGGGVGVVASSNPIVRTGGVSNPAATNPFPCPTCGRTAPETPGEALSETECQECGNRMPGLHKQTNKGPIIWTAEEKAAKLAMKAFDAEGNPQ